MLAGLCIDTFDLFLGGGVLGALVATGWSTLAANAHFQAGTFIGLAMGAYGAGFLSDRYGRRTAFGVNLLVFGVASLAAAAAPSMDVLILCRFVAGLGLGGEIVVSYAMLTEFAPPGARARWTAVAAIATAAMLFAANGTAYAVIPALGWRPVFATAGLLALAVWAARRRLPESPRWLAARGRAAEADAILRRFEQAAGLAAEDVPAVNRIPAAVAPKEYKPLRPLLVAVVLNVVCQIGFYGFSVWIPTFLVKQGVGLSHALGYSALMSLGQPLGAALCFILGDRMRRKTLLSGACLVLAALGLAFTTRPTPLLETILGFFVLMGMGLVVSLGQLIYTPELFPTALRSRGMGVANGTGRVAAILCPYAVIALYAWNGVGAVLETIGALFLLLAVIIILFGTETAGLPLEAISESASDH